ncbi:MAG: MauE/DoxX family redox-associated membrane protein [Nocardioidaceae bacterium]
MSTVAAARRPLRATFVRSFWPWLSIGARLVVGVVWIVAGYLKLQDIEDSVRSVRNFQILPEVLVRPVGTGLPIFEVVLGALLVVGLGLRVTGTLSALLQLAFIIGIASAWARGLQIDCGCFGGSGSLAEDATSKYPWELARDVGLLMLSVLIAMWPRSKMALDAVLLPPIDDER